MKEYKGIICKGSYLLNSACGHCEKCKDELKELRKAQILTGEDAKKFEEEMNNVKPLPTEERHRLEINYALLTKKPINEDPPNMLEEICERIRYLEIKNLESEKKIKDMEASIYDLYRGPARMA